MSEASFRDNPPLTRPIARPAPGARPDIASSHPARPRRGLLLCNLFTLAYRAMRCFAAADVEVHVLGNAASRGMRHSLICASYAQISETFDGTCSEAMIDAVNAAIARHGIDFVFAGDQPSTRSLIMMRDRLSAPCFPMPDLPVFDLLNDKWRFTDLCRDLAIRCPPTQVFDDRAALLASIADGTTTLPAVIKPLSLDGNRGVTEVTSHAEAIAARIDYQPVLVQHYIPGIDIGASVYADRGQVAAYICHALRRATYTALDQPVVLDALTRIVAATGTSGILNFDMRLAPDGDVYFLECNPRVFYKMNLSMLVGVNFASFGLTGTLCRTPAMPTPGTAVRSMKGIIAALASPATLTRRDRAMLGYILADIVPYMRENLRLDWEDRSY